MADSDFIKTVGDSAQIREASQRNARRAHPGTAYWILLKTANELASVGAWGKYQL
jgi:hypothetical protein